MNSKEKQLAAKGGQSPGRLAVSDAAIDSMAGMISDQAHQLNLLRRGALPLGALGGGGLIFALAGFEETAATAGELVSEVEDRADDLDLDFDLFNEMVQNLPLVGGRREEQVREATRQKGKQVMDAIEAALARAREAKGKIAGAAAAAKKFARAKPKIKEAEASFKVVRKLLRDYRNHPADPGNNRHIQELRDIAREAKDKLAADIEHLKEALEAID